MLKEKGPKKEKKKKRKKGKKEKRKKGKKEVSSVLFCAFLCFSVLFCAFIHTYFKCLSRMR
jgi:nitrate reductase NapE component